MVVSQIYLGSVAAIAQRFLDAAVARRPVRFQAREFGALFLAHEIEKRLSRGSSGIMATGQRSPLHAANRHPPRVHP